MKYDILLMLRGPKEKITAEFWEQVTEVLEDMNLRLSEERNHRVGSPAEYFTQWQIVSDDAQVEELADEIETLKQWFEVVLVEFRPTQFLQSRGVDDATRLRISRAFKNGGGR